MDEREFSQVLSLADAIVAAPEQVEDALKIVRDPKFSQIGEESDLARMLALLEAGIRATSGGALRLERAQLPALIDRLKSDASRNGAILAHALEAAEKHARAAPRAAGR
jgi:hypothetical protein